MVSNLSNINNYFVCYGGLVVFSRTGNFKEAGKGKPEVMKYKYKGYWSERIDQEHRLIYQVKDDEIRIVKCRFHYD